MRVDPDIYEQIIFPHLAAKCPVTVCHMSLYVRYIWKLSSEVKYPVHVLCFDWFMSPFFMCFTDQRDKPEDQFWHFWVSFFAN